MQRLAGENINLKTGGPVPVLLVVEIAQVVAGKAVEGWRGRANRP